MKYEDFLVRVARKAVSENELRGLMSQLPDDIGALFSPTGVGGGGGLTWRSS
jgi:hypothetical protein